MSGECAILTVSTERGNVPNTTTHHTNFLSLDEVREHIAKREKVEGGAYSIATAFSDVWITRADSPSKLPDHLSQSGNKLYWKGEWRGFSEAVRIREQNRGIGREG